MKESLKNNQRTKDALYLSNKLPASEREVLFRGLFENSSDAIQILDDFTFVECNQATVDILHATSKEDVLSTHPSQLSPEFQPDGRPSDEKADEMIRTALEKGGHRFEWMHRRIDGEDFLVEVMLTPVIVGGKTILYASWRDIAGRKQAEAEVRESQQLLESFMENFPDGAWVKDLDGRFVLANRYSYEKVAGYSTADKLLGKSVYDVYPKNVADSLWKSEKRLIETGEALSIEELIPQADGKTYNKITTKFPIYGKDGNISGLGGVLIDITERKRLEAQAQEMFERRGDQVQISTEISQQISQAVELDDLFERVVILTKERLGYYHTQLLRYDPTQDAVVLIVGYGETGKKMLEGGHNMLMGQGLIGVAAETGQTMMRPNLADDPAWKPNPLLDETRGEIAVPIKFGEQILGVLDVQSNQVNTLTDDDRLLLEGLCGQIAIAMHNVELIDASRQSEARLKTAASIAKLGYWDYNAETDMFIFEDNFYDMLHTTVEEQGGYQMSPAEYVDRFLHPDDVPLLFEAFNKAVASTEKEYNAPLEYRVRYADGGIGHVLVRIRVLRDDEGRIILHAGTTQDITEQKQAGEALAKRAAELQTVAEVSAAAAKNQEFDQFLQSVVDLTKSRFGLYHAHIYLVDDAQKTLVLTSGAGEVGKELVANGHTIELSAAKSLVARAAHERQPVVINDVHAEASYLPNPLLPKTRSELAVPLIVGEKVLGVLDVQSCEVAHFTQEDMHIQMTLAGQISVALQNVRTLQEANLFRLGVEQSAQAIFITSSQGEITYVNPAFEKVYGYSASEAIGKNPRLIKNGSTTPEQRAELSDMLERKHALSGEVVNRRKDGSLVSVHVSAVSVMDAKGELVGFLSIHQDITERKQAEEALRQSGARLAEAVELAQLAHWQYDAERDVFTFNDQFYALYHTTAEQHGGYELSSAYYAQHFVYPDDLPMMGEEIARALSSTDRQYRRSVEHRMLYADGSVGHVSIRIKIDRDEHGNILYYYGTTQDITEHKRAEEIIRQSEARLSEAADMAQLGYWELDIQAQTFTFTDQIYALLHTTAKEQGGYQMSIARYAQQFMHPDDAFAVSAETQKAIETPDPNYLGELEARIIRADGSEGIIAIRFGVVKDEQGRTVKTVGINQDITERKRAEQELERLLAEVQQSQRLFRSVIDSTPDWIFIKDQKHRYVLANKGYAKALHIEPDDFIGKDDLDLGFPEELVKGNPEKGIRGFWSDDRLVMDNNQPQVFPDDPATIDGVVHTFHTIKTPLQGDHGDVWGVLAYARDISDLKKANNIIAERADQLETVAAVSTAAATVLDPDKLLQTVLDLTQKRFDLYHAHIYMLDEAGETLVLSHGAGEVGRTMVANEHHILLGNQKSLVARAARENQAVIVNDVQAELGFLPNPLLPATQSEMAVPMQVGNRLLGIFDVQSDRVDHFTSEDANIYTTLAFQVAVALQNARLYADQAATVTRLRELDQLKSAFLSNMSHELRTPMNSILGFTDVLLNGIDGELTEAMEGDLHLIRKSGYHLLSLITDILDLSKIDAGKMKLSPESFNLYEMLGDVLKIVAPLVDEKAVALILDDKTERDIEIFADEGRIRQVLINLVNNAIKFTEKGQISVLVTRQQDKTVLIKVKDTGLGIPEDKVETIFQEFAQIDTSTTRKVGGTGLGLPISRRLANLHGGRIWAESTGVSGEGSTFYVELPLKSEIDVEILKQE